jgi:RHS repeat-associated protein
VDGVTTEYVLDVAGGLPEVIVATTDGASTYYVQVGGQILAQYDSGTWGYVALDALGSVRQLADTDGQVTLAQSYDPFGVLLEADGSGASDFGYTGEWYDSYMELLFLRARYFDPAIGRFLTKDPFRGFHNKPRMLNGYVYAENNPTNLVDPSGLYPPFPQKRIDFWKWVYSQDGLIECSRYRDDGQHSYDTVADLFIDYVCEYGPETRIFNETDLLTKQLAASRIIAELRQQFRQSGEQGIRGEKRFNIPEFLGATLDSFKTWDVSNSSRGLDITYLLKFVDVTHWLGSFEYEVRKGPEDRIRFWVKNETNLASGTRNPGVFEGVSLEEIMENPDLASLSTISVLKPKTRTETVYPEGGGTMYQIFLWYEPYQTGCLHPLLELRNRLPQIQLPLVPPSR